MIKINNIPEELKVLNQWVLWRYESPNGGKYTKIPYHHSGRFKARTTDIQTWSFFDEVIDVIDDPIKTASMDWQGIGFVFTDDDPYIFIDLDEKGDTDLKNEILEKFKGTYTETSPSGKGLHIICKSSVNDFKGMNRNGIEIYAKERYSTFTGNCETVYPILQMDEQVQWLLEKLEVKKSNHEPIKQHLTESNLTDQQIIDFILQSNDCDEFLTLWNGGLHGLPSNSEAVFRLCSILAARSMDRLQVERIFKQSILFKNHNEARPDKYRSAYYMERTLDNIFSTLTPAVKFIFDNNQELQVPAILETVIESKELANITDRTDIDYDWKRTVKLSVNEPLIYPPVKTCGGVLGDLVNYFYLTAGRPSYEVALATAIGLMAGIFGKSYNIGQNALNHYVLVLARAGRGKSTLGDSSAYLMSKVYEGLETGTNNVLFFFKTQSGEAIVKYLSEHNYSQVYFSSEFGYEITQSLDQKSSTGKFIISMYLQLYSKSKEGGVVNGLIYSDKKNNIQDIKRPAYSVCGESTYDSFYEKMTMANVVDGFIPRLLILRSTDDKPYDNELSKYMQPTPELLSILREMVDYTKNNLEPSNKIIQVMETKDTREFFRKIDREITDKENMLARTGDSAYCAIWSRVLEKTKRLAALIAIGHNYINPIVELEHAKYAYDMVLEDAKEMDYHFRTGGGVSSRVSDANLQVETLREGLKEYLNTPYHKIKSGYAGKSDWLRLYESSIVPIGYLLRKTGKKAVFLNSPLGANKSMKNAIEQLISESVLYKVPQRELDRLYGKINPTDYSFSGECWIIDKSQL